jgi:hypothetical protein
VSTYGIRRAHGGQLDPGRPYVDTSPSSGLYSQLPYIKRWGNSGDNAAGDVHYYNYEVWNSVSGPAPRTARHSTNRWRLRALIC